MTKEVRPGGLATARVSCIVSCLIACLALPEPAKAAPAKVPAKASGKAQAASGQPEPSWTLGREKDGLTLFYGLPNGTDAVITFVCMARSGDVSIRVPQDLARGSVDRSQSISLTLGGVRSSFAGSVSDDPVSGGLLVSVTVPARNPMFTALAGPGGMRIEGKGFTKIVPLRMIGEKLRQFLATCRKG
ncbi:hypothetical protein SAMN05519103_07943 [Rhizobiales bacterium GAS113]|nr:hypothetical protein SAMN05519103_07943 [Rhizobiales bacterium GAS113]SED12354.1 hypothetical protein SAMN05519104_2844 [Rhizobiales bacterium GAS188]